MDPSRVASHSNRRCRYVRFQLHAARCRLVAHSLYDRPDDCSHISRLKSELELTGDDTRYIEQVADEIVKEVSVPFNYVDAASKKAFVLRAGSEESRPSENRCEGVSQFVREGCEENVFGAIGLLQIKVGSTQL